MSYQVCGHCGELLGEKTLKEHHRLFSEGGEWIIKEGHERITGISSLPR